MHSVTVFASPHQGQATAPTLDRKSHSLAEWCALRGVSRSMFYKLDGQGLAPKTYNVGRKRMVSPDADAAWLRDREAESAQRGRSEVA